MTAPASNPRFVLVDADGRVVRSINASRRDTLYDVLIRTQIPFRSKCGGSSICGTCRVEIVDGELDPAAPDEAQLLQQHGEPAPRFRLACRLQIPADSLELRVRVPNPA